MNFLLNKKGTRTWNVKWTLGWYRGFTGRPTNYGSRFLVKSWCGIHTTQMSNELPSKNTDQLSLQVVAELMAFATQVAAARCYLKLQVWLAGNEGNYNGLCRDDLNPKP